MSSRRRLRTAFVIALFLAGIAAQSARAFAPFGANANFFMAGLPSLALVASPGAYALGVLLSIVLLKTIPAFEVASLAFVAIALAVYFARRLPLHPFVLHPVLSVFAGAAFYAALDRTFFLSHDIVIAEFFTTALISFMFTLLTSYVARK